MFLRSRSSSSINPLARTTYLPTYLLPFLSNSKVEESERKVETDKHTPNPPPQARSNITMYHITSHLIHPIAQFR